MEEIAMQIEQMAVRANAICDFAIVCGCIGLVLALFAAMLLFKQIREEKADGAGGSDKAV